MKFTVVVKNVWILKKPYNCYEIGSILSSAQKKISKKIKDGV